MDGWRHGGERVGIWEGEWVGGSMWWEEKAALQSRDRRRSRWPCRHRKHEIGCCRDCELYVHDKGNMPGSGRVR